MTTRSSETDIQVSNVKTEKSKSKITYSGATLISLPTNLKLFENYSYNVFKCKLKEYFLNLNNEVEHLENFSCINCKHVVCCNCNKIIINSAIYFYVIMYK